MLLLWIKSAPGPWAPGESETAPDSPEPGHDSVVEQVAEGRWAQPGSLLLTSGPESVGGSR